MLATQVGALITQLHFYYYLLKNHPPNIDNVLPWKGNTGMKILGFFLWAYAGRGEELRSEVYGLPGVVIMMLAPEHWLRIFGI